MSELTHVTHLRCCHPADYEVKVLHVRKDRARLAEAERLGVNSVPALVLERQPFHINFGPRSRH